MERRGDDWLGLLTDVLGVRPHSPPEAKCNRNRHKLVGSLEAAIQASEIRDGATLSFHHHFRNGDHVLNLVLSEVDRLGLRDIRVAASSIFPCHAMLVDLMRRGVVTRLVTDYVAGPVADFVKSGALALPLVLQTHGGRARAIVSGQLEIDVAFLGASIAHSNGAASGRYGSVPCGPLGYAMVDAPYARTTVILTPTLGDFAGADWEVPAEHVDLVVQVASVGEDTGIGSGTTVPSQTQEAARISAGVVACAKALELFSPDFGFQSGAGGYSLAAVTGIGEALRDSGFKGAFISGGITSQHVRLLEEGIVKRIYDVQCFDKAVATSSAGNRAHQAMSAHQYANPENPEAIVDRLSLMLMGAAEIDREFNVNVALSGDGRIIGGPGGHPDTAEGSRLAVVTTSLSGRGFPKIVEEVGCMVTPGKHVDLLVTGAGICVNPARIDLQGRLLAAGVELLSFDELLHLAASASSKRPSSRMGERVCAVVEGRRGDIADVVFASR